MSDLQKFIVWCPFDSSEDKGVSIPAESAEEAAKQWIKDNHWGEELSCIAMVRPSDGGDVLKFKVRAITCWDYEADEER